MPRQSDLDSDAKRWPLFSNVTSAYEKYRVLQCRRELETLMAIVFQRGVRTVLEIGCYRGGSMSCWSRVAEVDAKLIGVDDRRLLNSTPDSEEFQDYDLIIGRSADEETVDKVRGALSGDTVDFLFIDGGHDVDSVIADWEKYREFLSPRSIVAFHDVNESKKSWAGQVWRALSQSFDSLLISEERDWGGIGVLFTP